MKPWTLQLAAAVLSGALALGGSIGLGAVLRGKAGTSSPQTPVLASTRVPNAATREALLQQGEKFFRASCARCHVDHTGDDDGPDLHGVRLSDRRIAILIKRGLKGEMPSFARKYTDTDIAAIVDYLKTLD